MIEVDRGDRTWGGGSVRGRRYISNRLEESKDSSPDPESITRNFFQSTIDTSERSSIYSILSPSQRTTVDFDTFLSLWRVPFVETSSRKINTSPVSETSCTQASQL